MDLLDLPLLISLGRGVSLVAVVTLVYAAVWQRFAQQPVLRQVATGILFGAGALLSMLDPVPLADGVRIDARGVLVGMASPFGGPLAAVIAAGITASYRYALGGPAALSGIAGILIAASAGMWFARLPHAKPWPSSPVHLIALGLTISSGVLSFFLLPSLELTWAVLWKAGPPLTAANMVGALVFGTMLSRERSRLDMQQRLLQAATTDPLTELANRRALSETLGRELARARRLEAPLCVLAADIDRFKRVNDAFGHDAGDAVLKHVARVLASNIRAEDMAARLGGEEFCLVLPTTPIEGAVQLAERIRVAVASSPAETPAGPVNVTVSIGVAALALPNEGEDELLKRADEALYQAKAGGRDRVEVATPTPIEAARTA
ncbi:MAG TPA: diguanylate cyclase [Azospirillaceae bacterium]|nr:diguanylate cyclase [Azospirillaceae bacterium]